MYQLIFDNSLGLVVIHCPYFIAGESEAQGGYITCSGFHDAGVHMPLLVIRMRTVFAGA